MTSRELYEAVLIELHKENAPNILLEDFNYIANKAIYQYINKRYNIYDINQQTTDDLRVLKSTSVLTPQRVDKYDTMSLATMATYYVDLPSDYLHLLNCIVIYKVKKTYKCYNKGDTWRAAATRLTADAYSQVLDNFWNRPTYKRPYYYIHNVNTNNNYIPTNTDTDRSDYLSTDYVETSSNNYAKDKILGFVLKYNNNLNIGYYLSYDDNNNPKILQVSENGSQYLNPDNNLIYIITTTGLNYKVKSNKWKEVEVINNKKNIVLPNPENLFSTTKSLNEIGLSNVQKSALIRYGNASKVRMEIRYGTDTSVFTLDGGLIVIDYIKAPLHIRLTLRELDFTEDHSLMLEFPDYVCQEIVNELVNIIMERDSDPRLQTHPVVSLSIANPAQALAPAASGQSAQ